MKKRSSKITHTSEKISKKLSRHLSLSKISNIWEIGSRDGEDAKLLSRTFPSASIIAFEPNPDTYPKVLAACNSHVGRLTSKNIALSDTDGEIVFYKIDTDRTQTTWDDGNPGASSLFLANGEYPVETYVQIPIQVSSCTAKKLIEGEQFAVPNFIWMDVQGSEGLVLKGFGEFLSEVDSIYVELSLKAGYHGQALAHEIIKLLSKDFYWHSNLSTGKWQFDALFVNKKHKSRTLQLKHAFLVFSLKSKIRIFIRYHPVKSPISFLLNRFFRRLRIKPSNSS